MRGHLQTSFGKHLAAGVISFFAVRVCGEIKEDERLDDSSLLQEWADRPKGTQAAKNIAELL